MPSHRSIHGSRPKDRLAHFRATGSARVLDPLVNPSACRLVAATAYPLLLGAAVAGHLYLVSCSLPLAIATLLPVIATAVVILMLERACPYRSAWHAGRAECMTDLQFLALIQVLWPEFLRLTLIFGLPSIIRSLAHPAIWPHGAPLSVQLILLIAVADLLRYVLHRLAHQVPCLWRLHAVHHSPRRLYCLNAGRFHPVEKALQLLVDPLPFIYLGVGPNTLALYWVVYAANGLFQHCNVQLQYGPLNVLVGSAETHRWHHARHRTGQTSCNFGNTTILWDRVFGTWYLPHGAQVGALGLRGRRYPKSFSGLLRAPFTDGFARRGQADLDWTERLRAGAFWIAAVMIHIASAPRRALMAYFPAWVQRRTLRRILRANRHTGFGHAHGFEAIADAGDYRRSVPVHSYESLRERIEIQARDGEASLTAARPVFYALTSGTTGQPKRLPVIEASLDRYRLDQLRFIAEQVLACPGAFGGRSLVLSGDATGSAWHGHPTGAISAPLTAVLPRTISRSLVLPAILWRVEDANLRQKLAVRIALAERRISHIGCPNPSSLLRLVEILRADGAEFIDSLRTGCYPPLDTIAPGVRDELWPMITNDVARAEQLRRALGMRRPLLGQLWPSIRLLTTWTGGSCGIALKALREELPPGACEFDLGYIASEFRGTLPVRWRQGGLPTLDENFFEFVRCSDWDAGHPDFLPIDQLSAGDRYYLIATTRNGLYRYFIDDIVECTGFDHRAPLLRFVQKGRGCCSITGEKLYESQLLDAMRAVGAAHELTIRYFTLVADENRLGYELYLDASPRPIPAGDAIAATLDRTLARLNLEYRDKRASGRLRPPRLRLLSAGSGERIIAMEMARLGPGATYKPRVLRYAREIGSSLDSWVEKDDPPDAALMS